MPQFLENPLIVALDVDSAEQCLALVEQLRPYVGGFKLGPRLMVRYGANLSQKIAQVAPVFIDNKYLDIPSTMDAAIRASFEAGASLATVHAWAGFEALQLLAKTEKELSQIRPFQILAVTILTSFSKETLPPPQSSQEIATRVGELSDLVISAGLSGLVCSPLEVQSLRAHYPHAFLVTPGVRLPDDKKDDQARVLTPRQAMEAGASALVVGRPLYAAVDPARRAQEIMRQIQS